MLGRAGFGHGSRGLLAWCVSKSATPVWQKDPKLFSPRSATFNRADASNGGEAQLAGLRQGPPLDLSVSPVGRSAGGGSSERAGARSSNRTVDVGA